MRFGLAGLALIVATGMLYLSLTVHGPAEDGARGALLLAGSTVVLGAALLRARPGLTSMLLGFAGLVTLGAAGPGHRYLAAYAVAVLVLAAVSLLPARARAHRRPPPRRSRWLARVPPARGVADRAAPSSPRPRPDRGREPGR